MKRRRQTVWRLTELPGTLRTFDMRLVLDSSDQKLVAAIERIAAANGIALERLDEDVDIPVNGA